MPDIILLGATGFTGRLITRYLSTHPQRGKFTWAIAGRSVPKLEALAKEVGLSTDVAIVQVDVTNASEVERVVKTARVIINTVGPYHRWGTPVVRACVRHAVHYVDLTGETPWIREIIKEFDYAATKSGAIIVPSCGMDSVPSDISAYISNKTLKSALEERENDGTGSSVTTSLTAFDFKGGVSGGTLSTMMVTMEEVDRQDLSEASRPYSLSPVVGKHTPAFQALYRLAVPGEQPIVGGPFVMRGPNSAIVQRTFGLLELEAMLRKTNTQTLDSEVRARRERYGPLFQYDEFMVTSSVPGALLFSVAFVVTFMSLYALSPVRWLVKKFMPQPGEGPSDEAMKDGYLIGTNLTTSASNPPLQVKSVVRLKGDPGYLLTAAMISESALSLLLPPRSSNSSADSTSYSAIPTLPLLAQKGGVLTPMTAFGDVLLKRLEDTGLFEFTSTVVTEKQKSV
ncbi:hypothetical protein AMATHDRAFT_57582 [Amanita thiersii Skay4041]|uniref:Saccharopine dehydrogenase NADP binding domain-containing protein n=1 Tax=Amanita thiersii Skay4041 TaxID=703135 RepID=A0A2A9NMK4_9AGAR|nr:hypothetical protein AMATHDRAFT_57582 [Amanita thiersii Skay4041]